MPDPARRPILLLANPAAGRKPAGLGADQSQAPSPSELLGTLTDRGLEVELHELAEGEDAEALATAAAEKGLDVVIAGGDGTVGPAATGLVGSDATLGVVPMGTFNNIARGAGIPTDPAQALEVIVRGRSTAIDAGYAWHLMPGGSGDQRATSDPPSDATTFFEAVGLGVDAAGFGVAQVGDRLGWLSAAKAAWRIFRRRKTPIWLEVDGKRYRTASPALTVCNGPFHGFGFALVPNADPADGMLDVVVFLRMSRFAVLRHFLRVAGGRRIREPRVRTLRARHIVAGGLRHTLPVHADGRPIGTTPVAVTVRPGALRIFA